MTRLYTRRERFDFLAFMLAPACWFLTGVAAALLVAAWVVGA